MSVRINLSILHYILNSILNSVKDHNPENLLNIIPQCETNGITSVLNITRCIRRELFFSCQDDPMINNKNCKSLVEYGRGW